MNFLSGLTRVIWTLTGANPVAYESSFSNKLTINIDDISVIRTNEQNPHTVIIFNNSTTVEVKESYEEVLLLIKGMSTNKQEREFFLNVKDEKPYKKIRHILNTPYIDDNPNTKSYVDPYSNEVEKDIGKCIEYLACDSFNNILGYVLASDRLEAISKVKKFHPSATWFRQAASNSVYGLYNIKDGKYVPARLKGAKPNET